MTARTLARTALVLAVSALAPIGAASGDGETKDAPPGGDWPFGSSGGSMFSRKDYFNLGILGAKASDADRPAAAGGEGVRQVKMEAYPAADIGPDRLKVELLFEGGPAAKAGLRLGDVITGVNGRTFKDGSVAPLAKAITDAESGAAKAVVLAVLREKSTVQVPVTIPVAGKDFANPIRGKARVAILKQALDVLAKRQDADGGYPQTLCGETGAVVQASMAGLAWLAAGSDLTKGPHAENVRRAAAFVAAHAESEDAPPASNPNHDQTNWGVTHAAIFIGELESRSHDPANAELLRRLGASLAKRQETTGGWAHGPGGPNGLGYVELNIVSGLAMLGMGLARQAGYEPPIDVLVKARRYIEDSSGGDGGIGYSTKPGQQGQGNIGRTAVTWMGYSSLGLAKEKWSSKMSSYVAQHAGDVFEGHASLMQHFLFAGIAAQTLGGEASKEFWEVGEPNLVLARAPDGTFQPRPFHESLQMGSNSDVTFGDTWTTAAWAVVLGCGMEKEGLPGLPAATGKLQPKAAPKAK